MMEYEREGRLRVIRMPHAALHFSPTGLAWISSIYTLPFGGLLLLGGRAGDILGRRRAFVAGLALFGVASMAGGLATSVPWLLAARAAQGVGAAFAAPNSVALVTSNFEEGIYGFLDAASSGWGAVVLVSLLAAVVLLGAFLAVELRARQPVVPLTLFRDRNRSAA
jgi:MFS family permease